MNASTLFDIYSINSETEGEDLTVSLAKYKAEHPGMSQEEDKAIRAFIGKYGRGLAAAFRRGRATFEAVAEVLYTEDGGTAR
jgi:hypothetical protein